MAKNHEPGDFSLVLGGSLYQLLRRTRTRLAGDFLQMVSRRILVLGRRYSAILGRAEGVKGSHDLKRYPDSRLIPGLVSFRRDAPLFFANAELFEVRVLDAVASSPTLCAGWSLRRNRSPAWI